MRRHLSLILGAAAVAAVVLAGATPVAAQRGRGGAAAPDAGRDEVAGPRDAGRRGMRPFANLNLTEAQRTTIADIMRGSRDRVAPIADELRLAERNLHRAVFADTPDTAAVNTLVAQVESLRKQIADERLRTQTAIAAELTPEQREQVRVMGGLPGMGGPRMGAGRFGGDAGPRRGAPGPRRAPRGGPDRG